MFSILIFTLIGSFIGILSSLFGFGGGLVVVPVLYAFLPESIPNQYIMHTAIGTSLAVMIVNSLNSTFSHSKQGHVQWPIFKYLVMYIAAGALIGGLLASYFPSEILRYLFIMFLIYVIMSNIFKKTFTKERVNQPFLYPTQIAGAGSGLAIGSVSTLLGIGGSVMTIPYLRKRGLSMLHVVALATPLGLPIAIVGTFTYLITGFQTSHMPISTIGFIYLPALIGFTIGGFFGVPIGRRIAQALPDLLFSKAYIALLIIVVVMMIVG